MEERIPLLKRADQFVFKKIDEFRTTPAHSKLLENYTSLDENEQKVAKALMLAATAIIPLIIIATLWIANSSVKSDLLIRTQLVERMQEIMAQNSAAGSLASTVAAPNTFLDQSELSSQISNIASSSGLDASKLRVSNFTTDSISATLSRVEADFMFEGVSTSQLMTLFTSMLGRERFRISTVSIKRNDATKMLEGTFHAVHFGQPAIIEDDQ